jgi:hypothetical protein
MVDVLKELHKSDPMSTKVGAAMASNTALYFGDSAPPPVEVPPSGTKTVPKVVEKGPEAVQKITEKPSGFNLFKKKNNE